jgi:hypothetical protein
VSGLLVQPVSRLLALMWFARWVLINRLGSTDPRRFSRLDDRPINIMPSASPQPVTPSAYPLAPALNLCAASGAITPSPSLLAGSGTRLRSILSGAMAGLVDAAIDHDGPGDPRGLVGDRDRRLLFRHAAEQLRDPGILVGADLRLAHLRHGAVDEKRAQIAIALLGKPLLLDLAVTGPIEGTVSSRGPSSLALFSLRSAVSSTVISELSISIC